MIDHATLRTAAILLTCLAFLALTGSLTAVNDRKACGLTIPVINTWTQQREKARDGEKTWDRTGEHLLAFCMIIQNQHKDIREWVGHHHSIGANTIYVHDHRSEPPLRELLTDYIDSGVVQYVWWNKSWDNWHYTQDENPQMDVYETCLRKYRDRHQFIAFLDSDEFLVLQDPSIPSVPHLLRSMLAERQFGGLAVHWRVFGSSGHIDPPQDSVLKAFTKCTPIDWESNKLVKSIANTDYAVRAAGHILELNNPDVPIVKENWQVVNASKCPPSVQDKIAIHHYMIKSKTEFDQKMQRGGGSGRKRKKAWFNKVDKFCNETCLAGARLGPYY